MNLTSSKKLLSLVLGLFVTSQVAQADIIRILRVSEGRHSSFGDRFYIYTVDEAGKETRLGKTYYYEKELMQIAYRKSKANSFANKMAVLAMSMTLPLHAMDKTLETLDTLTAESTKSYFSLEYVRGQAEKGAAWAKHYRKKIFSIPTLRSSAVTDGGLESEGSTIASSVGSNEVVKGLKQRFSTASEAAKKAYGTTIELGKRHVVEPAKSFKDSVSNMTWKKTVSSENENMSAIVFHYPDAAISQAKTLATYAALTAGTYIFLRKAMQLLCEGDSNPLAVENILRVRSDKAHFVDGVTDEQIAQLRAQLDN